MFTVGKYKNRWAVLDTVSNCWYFAEKTGLAAAVAFAQRLNNGE